MKIMKVKENQLNLPQVQGKVLGLEKDIKAKMREGLEKIKMVMKVNNKRKK